MRLFGCVGAAFCRTKEMWGAVCQDQPPVSQFHRYGESDGTINTHFVSRSSFLTIFGISATAEIAPDDLTARKAVMTDSPENAG